MAMPPQGFGRHRIRVRRVASIARNQDAPVWDASTSSKTRDRLLEGDVARQFLAAIVVQPCVKALMSDEHFSVDGTLKQAWANHRSFQPKADGAASSGKDQPPGSSPASPPSGGRNGERDLRGQSPSNEAHASKTDPDV